MMTHLPTSRRSRFRIATSVIVNASARFPCSAHDLPRGTAYAPRTSSRLSSAQRLVLSIQVLHAKKYETFAPGGYPPLFGMIPKYVVIAVGDFESSFEVPPTQRQGPISKELCPKHLRNQGRRSQTSIIMDHQAAFSTEFNSTRRFVDQRSTEELLRYTLCATCLDLLYSSVLNYGTNCCTVVILTSRVDGRIAYPACSTPC